MTLSRATSSLDWGGSQVEPSSGAKSAGWATGTRPTAQAFNWAWGTIDDWTKFHDEQVRLLHLRAEQTALASLTQVETGLASVPLAFACSPSGVVVAVGGGGLVVRSAGLDSSTWSNDTLGSSSTEDMDDATHNGTVFLACGTDEIHSSTGNGTWTRRVDSAGKTFGDICAAPNGVVVATYTNGSGSPGAAVSPDGVNSWVLTGQAWDNSRTPLCYDTKRGRFVAINFGDGDVYVNADPVATPTWTKSVTAE